MYLAKTLTLRSLPEIGRRFGGRDHTTVLHAVRKIEGLVGNDMALAEEIEILEAPAAGVSRAAPGRTSTAAGRLGACGIVRLAGNAAKRAESRPWRLRHCCSSPLLPGPAFRERPAWSSRLGFQDRFSRRRSGSPMKVTVERAELLKSLGHVHRVVERRNTIPILANVLIKADKGKLSLKATDLDLEVTDSIAAEVSPGGATTVPAHMFYEIVRKLPEGAQIVIEGSGDRAVLSIRAGRSRFTLADAAGERLSRSRRRRDDAFVQARGRRSQAADRQDPVRDLDRRDALLPQRHLSAHRRQRPSAERCARSRPTAIGWRRSNCRCRKAPPACRASSCRARPSPKCSA